MEWKYFVISYTINNIKISLTSELCSFSQAATYETISRNGKEYKNVDDVKKFIQEYKIKWESGSNNTTQEIRDQKLDELLDK